MLVISEDGQEIDDLKNENDDDAGYPRSPESDTPESAFNNTNRVKNIYEKEKKKIE